MYWPNKHLQKNEKKKKAAATKHKESTKITENTTKTITSIAV